MKYLLNEYLPFLDDICTRVVAYPENQIGARIVAEYKSRGINVFPVFSLLDCSRGWVPRPSEAIDCMRSFVEENKRPILFVGVDSYLEFLSIPERRDFFAGIYQLLELQKFCMHILVSLRIFRPYKSVNPKYEDSLQVIVFSGEEKCDDLSITMLPERWGSKVTNAHSLFETIALLGIYSSSGEYLCWVNEKSLPSQGFGNVEVINDPFEALRVLYNLNLSINQDVADRLACECNERNQYPIEIIIDRFGGETYLSCRNAPARLFEMKDDCFWDLFVWLLKARVKEETYLHRVLSRSITRENFLEEYVVWTAIDSLEDNRAKELAEERAEVLRNLNSVDPLIARFVIETEDEDSSVVFLNCGTSVEMQGLIRRAAKYDLELGLPTKFDTVAPTLRAYLSNDFDYPDSRLTAYFSKLRQFRLKNTVDEAFVQEAYEGRVPSIIRKRDQVLPSFDDGKTALLVVDGLGAEYYPLLLNMAKKNNIGIAEKEIVEANLPTSTEFNPIKWSEGNKLAEVKRADNISHEGYSKHEKCTYEENLAELFIVFQKTILTRVVDGLKKYDRVVVTADHGSSYLAVVAYWNNMVKTIKWDDPVDWRYSTLKKPVEAKEGIETVYRAFDGLTYYVIKGYNRFPKQGPKLYGLHGGATLEERLVPLVVFVKYPEMITENNIDSDFVEEKKAEQIIEREGFDIL